VKPPARLDTWDCLNEIVRQRQQKETKRKTKKWRKKKEKKGKEREGMMEGRGRGVLKNQITFF